MVQMHKSTKDSERFGGLNPGSVRVRTENSKAEVILSICAIFRPATALFSSVRLKSCPNLAENVGTKGTNGGAEAPPKQQNPNEPNKGIAV